MTVYVAYCVENLDPTHSTVRPCALLRLDLNAGVRFRQIPRLKTLGRTNEYFPCALCTYAKLGDGRYSYNTDGLVIVMLVAIEVMMIVMLLIILRYFFIILSRQ